MADEVCPRNRLSGGEVEVQAQFVHGIAGLGEKVEGWIWFIHGIGYLVEKRMRRVWFIHQKTEMVDKVSCGGQEKKVLG